MKWKKADLDDLQSFFTLSLVETLHKDSSEIIKEPSGVGNLSQLQGKLLLQDG